MIQTHIDKADARNINIYNGSSHMCCVSPDEPERVPGHVAGGSDQEIRSKQRTDIVSL